MCTDNYFYYLLFLMKMVNFPSEATRYSDAWLCVQYL
jgi:hypothetical protein